MPISLLGALLSVIKFVTSRSWRLVRFMWSVHCIHVVTQDGTPLRPILSMTGSSHHKLGKWLASLLQPVLDRFSSHCISDSFAFVKTMQNLDIDPNVFMCSFDMSSLFTNVPLDETFKICSDALYDDSD